MGLLSTLAVASLPIGCEAFMARWEVLPSLAHYSELAQLPWSSCQLADSWVTIAWTALSQVPGFPPSFPITESLSPPCKIALVL